MATSSFNTHRSRKKLYDAKRRKKRGSSAVLQTHSPADWTWRRAGSSDSDPVKGWGGCCLEGEWRASTPPGTPLNAHMHLPVGFHPEWHQTYPTSEGKHSECRLTCFPSAPVRFSQIFKRISDKTWTHRGALRKLVCSHHLHVQVLALRLAPGFDQPLEHLPGNSEVSSSPTPAHRGVQLYLRRGNLDVDDDGRQGGFGQLCRVIDGVGVQDHQLQGFGQLKYPLDLALNLGCTDDTRDSPRLRLPTHSCRRWRAHLSWSECWIAPWWAVCWAPTSWLKKDPLLLEWLRFCRKPEEKKQQQCFQSDLFRLSTLLVCSACCWPSLKSVFQKVKKRFLHHVRHLGNTRKQALLKGNKIVFSDLIWNGKKDHHC